MPELNSWWEEYGCNICNKNQLLVIDLNVKSSDPKDEFIEYCNVNNVQYPAVWSGEGGRDLADAMGLGVSANSKFLIKPDRSFSSGVYSNTLTKEGIVGHQCDPVKKIGLKFKEKREIGVVRTGNAIQLNNLNKNIKSVKLYDFQGKLLWSENLINSKSTIKVPNNFGKGLKIISLIGTKNTKNLPVMVVK